MNDLKASSSDNAVMYSTDNQTFEQIIKYYLNDVKRILDEMKTLVNLTDRRALTDATTTEKTVVVPDLSTLLDNKISIVNKLTALLENSRLKGSLVK